jgi:uncharacterized protein YecE (DUF72 family)
VEEKTNNIWNKIVELKDEELNIIREIIYSLTQKDVDLYINVNNHYEGSAPLTIEKLKQHLKS